MPSSDERLLAMLIYLVSFFVPILGPLLIWLLKRDESDFIDYHGKEYFNFFISFTIYSIISGILVLVLIGFVLLFVVGILLFIFTIIALFKAYQGERYRIPLVIHMIK
ncbi:hypothetical protein SAMN05216389_106155 [Oceanobacillus limi]|uniref:DUF4870 domain-containing protein n=1 Tax=Oceanobacillus limi TaxID=930131 RepID=A0A1I0CCE9_9BACI|nr:DUF4870 domain-containing protein [Oceanobacillus limi]SET17195.1 hypothetical protein SAMN05216389_106155 [Oceanobacillus limi]